MGKPVLTALLFVVCGAVAFALAAPLLFPRSSNFERVGQVALPVIAVVMGVVGYFVGSRKRG
jgi:hypothetical protein